MTDTTENRADQKRTFKFWPGVLPGTKRDYFLIFLVLLDIFFILILNSYERYLPGKFSQGVFAFDLFVTVLWGINFLVRLSGKKNKIAFIRMHWYELPGLIPIVFFRTFLLLHAAKLVIAYYKIARSTHLVRKEDVREVSFRFRDVIIDAIADAVFLQSLTRVEEVMKQLDYTDIAHKSFEGHHDELIVAVNNSLKTKSLIGEISSLPFMSGLGGRLGDDVSSVIAEILEDRVMGDVMKQIIIEILYKMREKVWRLDLERIIDAKNEEKNVL